MYNYFYFFLDLFALINLPVQKQNIDEVDKYCDNTISGHLVMCACTS